MKVCLICLQVVRIKAGFDAASVKPACIADDVSGCSDITETAVVLASGDGCSYCAADAPTKDCDAAP
jgi:hypothetical protein